MQKIALMVCGALATLAAVGATTRNGKEYLTLDELPVACREEAAVPNETASLLPTGLTFRLVWHDEFNGTSLDTTKWMYRTNFWGRPAHWFSRPGDGSVEVSDGTVKLKLLKLPNGQFVSPQLQTGSLLWDTPRLDDGKGNCLSSWYIGRREKPLFTHRFGYYECRAKLQKCKGWWSAFWMQTESQGATLDPAWSGIEHDIMESFEPGEVSPACFHYNGYGPNYKTFRIPDCPMKKLSMLDVNTDEYHTFGLLWEPTGYSIYVDGRLRGRNSTDVSKCPEFLLISTEAKWYRKDRMTGKGVPELEAAAAAGDAFTVDYVRVYDIVHE